MRKTPVQQSPATTVQASPRAWLALAALSLGFFMTLLDQSVVAVALPGIAADFGADVTAMVWVSSIYLLSVAVPLLVTGRLGDRFGHRRLFLLGVLVFTLGAVASAAAPALGVLLGARAVQGLGASLLMPQTMAVINQVFPREKRGTALGVWGVVGSVASLVGPVLGGTVVSAFGWQGVFVMHLPVGLLALLLAALWVPRLPAVYARIDAASVGLAVLAVGLIIASIQVGQQYLPAWLAWGMLAAGVAAGAWFLARQRRVDDPLVPPRVFADRNFSAATLAIVAMGFVAASVMIPVMMWLQSGLGVSPMVAGWAVSPMAVVSMLMGPVVGVLADRMNPRTLSVAGFLTMILAMGMLWVATRATEPGLAPVVAAVAVLGVGQTFIWATNAATAMRDLAPDVMGAASGVYNTARQLGSVVGVAVVGAVMGAGVATVGSVAGVAWAFPAIAVALVCGLLASLFLRPTLLQQVGPKH